MPASGQLRLCRAEAVADFTAGACSSAVEGFYGGGEVVGFGLERDYGVDFAFGEEVGSVGVLGIELLNFRTLYKGHIILIGRYEAVGVHFRGLFDKAEERRWFLYAVDNESAVEYFVAAVFGVYLREAENFAVGERTAKFFSEFAQILLFVGAQCEAFAAVVFADVGNINDRFRFCGRC